MQHITMFRILTACICLTACTVTSEQQCQFNDVASHTVVAGVIFEGQMTSLPVRSNRSNVLNDSRESAVEVGFNVERVVKGEFSAGSVFVLYKTSTGSQCSVEDDSDEAESVDGAEAVVGMRYVVFLNMTRSTGNRTTFWSLGGILLYTSKVQRTVLALACAQCGQAPVIRVSPRSLRVRDGQKLTLHCRASGKPGPVLSWLRDQTELTVISSANVAINKRGNSLHLKRVSVNDVGVYWCRASNVLGSVIGAVASINVTTVPDDSDDHHEPCLDQNYCLNNGFCYNLPAVGQKFCRCTASYDGSRCQNKKVRTSRPNQGDDSDDRIQTFQLSLTSISNIVIIFVSAILVILLVYIIHQAKRRCSATNSHDNGQVAINETDPAQTPEQAHERQVLIGHNANNQNGMATAVSDDN